MTQPGKPASKPPVDWDQVAIDIRAGILTDRQIGEKVGRSHGAIQQYAKKHGIERDLSDRIKERTKQKLARAQLAKSASQERLKNTDEQTIELAAEVASTIVIKQQGRIAKHQTVAESLLLELEQMTNNRELFEEFGEIMRAPSVHGQDKRNDLYVRVIDMPNRVDAMKKLSDTLKTLIGLEREAFGIESVREPGEVTVTRIELVALQP